MTIAKGTLMDGTEIEYIVTPNPPRGSKKYTYFTPDGDFVVQFYNDKEDAASFTNQERLQRILTVYNPTLPQEEGGALGVTKKTAEYFSNLFCWPFALIEKPEFGIVCPTYPQKFFFNEESVKKGINLDLKGKDKKSRWFTSSVAKYLADFEKGNIKKMLRISISLARAVRRMHSAGLAHSDLSCNNVLIDPVSGTCVVIDIDSLVVPGLFPPEVAGTRGYIAPEVLATLNLDFTDSARNLPCITTDLFALPVLIYEYLLKRHPLQGPKIHSSNPEEDDFLTFGSNALFIENPQDTSNRPNDLKITVKDFGSNLKELFLKAFVDGLHNPQKRPSASAWERALVKAWDLLQPCQNPNCPEGWFILHDIYNPVCPFCGQKIHKKDVMHLRLKKTVAGLKGNWQTVGEINLYDKMPLFLWHFRDNVFPDEKLHNRELQAYIYHQNGVWYLINNGLEGLLSPSGNLVPKGQAIHLKKGVTFLSGNNSDSLLLEVVQS